MDTLLFAARTLLALVFVASAVSKALDLRGTSDGIRSLGFPAAVSRGLTIALPPSELGLALCLMLPAAAPTGSVISLVLLVAFTAVLSWNVARGRQVACHCFGQVNGDAPISWRTIARNGVLMAVALFTVVFANRGGSISRWEWLSSAPAVSVVALALVCLLTGAVAVLAWLHLQLMRQNGRLLLRLDVLEASPAPQRAGAVVGLKEGTVAPRFELPRLGQGTVSLDSALHGGLPILLVFVSPGCGPCKTLLPHLSQWQSESADALRILVIGRDRNRLASELSGIDLADVLVQDRDEVATAYQALGTPSAVLVGPDGRIRSGSAQGEAQVRALYSAATSRAAPRSLVIGEPVPSVALTSRQGDPVDARAALTGATSVLLFWNPSCGFCQQMLPALTRWRASAAAGSPRLVVITSAPLDDAGFADEVLIDKSFALGTQLGAAGTPSAVRVNAAGVISSTVVVGATSILDTVLVDAEPPGRSESRSSRDVPELQSLPGAGGGAREGALEDAAAAV